MAARYWWSVPGRVGEPKIRGLLPTGAKIRVVAHEAATPCGEWARNGEIVLEERGFVLSDLDNVFLVVVATSSRDLNEFVFGEAQSRRILCNVVDVPDQCDFYYPAVVQRGDLQIAISTSGQSPSLAQKIRQQLERQFGPGYAHWVAELGETRRKVLASNLDPERKRRSAAITRKRRGIRSCARNRIEHQYKRCRGMTGKVYLVGAGPGDPELLTLKAARVLKQADAVLHDDLVSAQILQLAPAHAQVRNVGKRCGKKNISQAEINFLMVTLAASGLQVVRLKGGDPLIFGRLGEEIAALRKANVDFEIVPGITAALGAASTAQIPLTHRQSSHALVFLTGHSASGADPTNWRALVSLGATVVIYMPGHHYSEIARKLRAAGLSDETPCAIISRATTSEEQIFSTDLEGLKDAHGCQRRRCS